MQQNQVQTRWYAARSIPMPDDDERGIASVLIWIERRNGGMWAVGRANDLAQRSYAEPQEGDFLFQGYDMDDAIREANEALEDELVASEHDGMDMTVRPFTRPELEEPLNEWFWGRRPS